MPPQADIAAVILAAGRGARMQAVPSKLLHPLDGQPLLRHAVRAVLASQVVAVYVVLGHQGDAVRAAVQDLPVQFVENAEHAEGMASSIRTGVRAAVRHAGILICLGDMPRVDAASLDALIAAQRAHPQALAIRPAYRGQPGNPVLWTPPAFPDLLALQGDQGARAFLHRHADRVHVVDVACAGVLLDVDTPQDLRELGA